MPTCEHESPYLTHYDNATPAEVIKACQELWVPGAVPNPTAAFIGGEVKCSADAYQADGGRWVSPWPAVCGTVEAAAAVFGVGPVTPGCCLWFWCTSPEPASDGTISIQWIVNMQQAYDFS